MKNKSLITTASQPRESRRNERGAALVTTMLIATLLLATGGALVVTTTMSNTTAIDSTADVQAYYAAETGLQAALNALRGNSPPQVDNSKRINFRNANLPAQSNRTGDALTNPDGNAATIDGTPRLSEWLPYNGTGQNARVPIADTNTAYIVEVLDPNDPTRLQISTLPNYSPAQLLVRATGFGPRGARRSMEMLVNRFAFSFSADSTVLMIGAEDGSAMPGFAIGQSNAKTYSGYDNADPSVSLPVFGTTHAADKTTVEGTVASSKPNTVSGTDKVKQLDPTDLESWMRSPDEARALLLQLQSTAQSMGRHFTDTPDDFGSASEPKFTFVDGDASLKGSGGGLLVVTGNLTVSGNFSFNGLILVLGEGSMRRNGGGNGDIMGAIVVARFERTWPSSENGQPHPFLTPTFDTNGGGNSTVQYDSNAVNNAMGLLGSQVGAVREF